MKKLYFVGTAGFIPTKNRDNCSVLYSSADNKYLLIDCPGSIVQKLMRLDIDINTVRNIFISHCHPDHVYGLPALIHNFYDKKGNIKIYCSVWAKPTIEAMLDIHGLRSERFPEMQIITLQANDKLRLEGLTLEAIENVHSQDSLALSVFEGNSHIIYSSDTRIDHDIAAHIRKNTVLIHECTCHSKYFEEFPQMHKSHCSSLDLRNWLNRLDIKPKAIYPIHFMLRDDNDLEIMQEELRGFDYLYWPEDLSSIEL